MRRFRIMAMLGIQPFKLRLEPRQRCTQLMRHVGEKILFRATAVLHPCQQVIDGTDKRRNLARRILNGQRR